MPCSAAAALKVSRSNSVIDESRSKKPSIPAGKKVTNILPSPSPMTCQVCDTPRGMNTNEPGPVTLSSSPSFQRNSPSRT